MVDLSDIEREFLAALVRVKLEELRHAEDRATWQAEGWAARLNVRRARDVLAGALGKLGRAPRPAT